MEQSNTYSANPNLVEGRELYQPLGIAIDNSGAAPAILCCDTGNNRVLGWKNAAAFSNGQMADIVVGQVDFWTTWPQGPGSYALCAGAGHVAAIGVEQPHGPGGG